MVDVRSVLAMALYHQAFLLQHFCYTVVGWIYFLFSMPFPACSSSIKVVHKWILQTFSNENCVYIYISRFIYACYIVRPSSNFTLCNFFWLKCMQFSFLPCVLPGQSSITWCRLQQTFSYKNFVCMCNYTHVCYFALGKLLLFSHELPVNRVADYF